MFIYITTNKINNKKYIGMCTRDDSNYLGSGSLLKQAIKKYGKENFYREIIEHCDDFLELCEREKFWIDHYNAVESEEFYNLIDGGIGGNSEHLKQYWQSLSEEERKRVRNWKPNFKINPPKGKNNPMYGKSTSKTVKDTWDKRDDKYREEFGTKISKARKESGIAKGKNNPMYGRSAVVEKNLKWYTNDKENIYVTEGTQPNGFRRGRKRTW